MKLLQINKLYPPHLGGIETVVRDIAEYLAQTDSVQSDVLVCQEKGRRVADDINGVRVYRAASWGRLLSLPLSFDFFFLFRKLVPQYDIILIHQPFPLASLARFFFARKKKVAVWYHSDIIRQKFFRLFFYPFLYLDLKAASVIFVSSRRLAENSSLLKKFFDKCQVIPFGVKLADYEIDNRSKVADLHARYGRFALAVGRLVYYKGFEYLVEAMASTKAKLLIVGAGPLEARLRQLIKENNLADQVFLLTERAESLIPYYQACEFLILPSVARSEAFGLVQIEAMACGKPVINTNLPTGVPEVSLDRETGLTVPVVDSRALGEAINELWENDSLRLEMGLKSKERAKKVFDLDQFNLRVKESLGKML